MYLEMFIFLSGRFSSTSLVLVKEGEGEGRRDVPGGRNWRYGRREREGEGARRRLKETGMEKEGEEGRKRQKENKGGKS